MVSMAEPLANLHTLADAVEFERWVKLEQRRVFLLCQRMLQDEEEADAASQDVFVKAHRALQQASNAELDDPHKWVTRIAVNTCLDRLRSRRWQFWRKRPKSQDETLILGMAESTDPNAEDHVFAAQIRQQLKLALNKLSDRQRAVFTLRHYEDLSMEEIGQTLGLDSGTVKAHLFRATSKLREELRELYTGKVSAKSSGTGFSKGAGR
jgi:RNA polymerase sigma-70 factor, ECF subfamily